MAAGSSPAPFTSFYISQPVCVYGLRFFMPIECATMTGEFLTKKLMNGHKINQAL